MDKKPARNHRITSGIFLVLCILLAIAAVFVGIDDNPPGVLLALLSAIAFILAFAHSWRKERRFIFLLLVSVLGIALFIVLSIVSDSILQNPMSPTGLREYIESPVNEALSVVFSMLLVAAILVGVIGGVIMFFRGRIRKK